MTMEAAKFSRTMEGYQATLMGVGLVICSPSSNLAWWLEQELVLHAKVGSGRN
jgi:hypothetical protein